MSEAGPGAGRALALTVFLGLLMAMSAIGTDLVLPGLPAVAAEFGARGSTAQWVVYAYFLGFAATHLLIGPLADKLGRKTVLLPCLIGFALASAWSGLAQSVEELIASRFAQGAVVAGAPILARAILRDLFAGEALAKRLAWAMTIFAAGPALAPPLGGALLLVADWRLLFWAQAAFAAVMTCWAAFGLPETGKPSGGVLRGGDVAAAIARVLRHHETRWSLVALAGIYGCLIGFLASAPDLFTVHLGANPQQFGLAFGAVAATIALSQIANARALERHSSAAVARFASRALMAAMAAAALLLAVVEPGWVLVIAGLIAFAGTFSVALANNVALAMRPWSSGAGAASGAVGFAMLALGAVVGMAVGALAILGVWALFAGFAAAAALAVLADAKRAQP